MVNDETNADYLLADRGYDSNEVIAKAQGPKYEDNSTKTMDEGFYPAKEKSRQTARIRQISL